MPVPVMGTVTSMFPPAAPRIQRVAVFSTVAMAVNYTGRSV